MSLKIFVFILLLGIVLSLPLEIPSFLSDKEEWENFKDRNNKSYESPEEEQRRFQIFKDNLAVIKQHNNGYKKGETTYIMGLNQFADLTHKEFLERVSGYTGSKQ